MSGLFGGLLAVDEHVRTEHSFLTAADCCHCLAEYFPQRGYRANQLNQLIVNLKCLPSIASRDPRRMHYKLRAIDDIARALRGALSRSSVECATWIPIPRRGRRAMRTMTIACNAFWPRLSSTTPWICEQRTIRVKPRRRTIAAH